MWFQRDISLYGKIHIVKTLALSKLIFICSVLESPGNFAGEVNKIIFDFIWNYKPAKIRKTTLIKNKEEGGLNMKDFSLFDQALKLNWVKHLRSHTDAPWKYIPTYYLANVGGTELFHCNYDFKLLSLNKSLPKFYKHIIQHWQVITANSSSNKKELLEQVIWNNQFVKVDGILYKLVRGRRNK